MASAITLPVGSDLMVDLDITIADRKPLIVRRDGHLRSTPKKKKFSAHAHLLDLS